MGCLASPSMGLQWRSTRVKLNLQRSETQSVLELHGCMDEGQRADLQRKAEHVKAEIEAVETRIAPIATTVKRLKKAMSHGKPKSIDTAGKGAFLAVMMTDEQRMVEMNNLLLGEGQLSSWRRLFHKNRTPTL
ncbi:MAG: hypothetical protein BYD32DRAFT_435362 [Podila humilis]|nr:MAG: hypothetical protein BYD32DRAFT_435362 [Podila humilis]